MHQHGGQENKGISPVPLVGRAVASIVSMTTITVLAVLLSRRIPKFGAREWRHVPLARWLLIMAYFDSFVFVFFTAILNNGFGLDGWLRICTDSQFLCVLCYVTSKLFIYLFLVEKAYIIRGKNKPRLKDKLYIFNFFGMLGPYTGAFIAVFFFRFSFLDPKGVCYMGIYRIAIIPTFVLEITANVYLTALFIIPIRKLYSYRHGSINSPLRTVAIRTLIGSIATLTVSALNLGLLLFLEKEPAWMCLMLCNVDILFCALILHWVTIVENTYKLPSRYNPEDERSVFHYNYNHNNNHHNQNSHSNQNHNMNDVTTAPTQSRIANFTFPGRVLGHVDEHAGIAATTETTATATATGDRVTPRRLESTAVYTASSGGSSGDVDVGAGGLQLEMMSGESGKVEKGEGTSVTGACGEVDQDDRASEGGGNVMDVVNSSTERIVGLGSGGQ